MKSSEISNTPDAASSLNAMNMLKGQLVTNRILDKRVLDAIMATPRELFLPEHLQGSAYVDEDLPLGQNRFLLEPLTFARMVAFSEIKSGDAVLDIGSGLGYSPAVLARLAKRVVACENIAEFSDGMAERLQSLGIVNVKQVAPSRLSDGYSDDAPYDVIFVNGAIQIVPEDLAAQLSQNGRMVAIVCHKQNQLSHGTGDVTMSKKIDGRLYPTSEVQASCPLLPTFSKPARFIF